MRNIVSPRVRDIVRAILYWYARLLAKGVAVPTIALALIGAIAATLTPLSPGGKLLAIIPLALIGAGIGMWVTIRLARAYNPISVVQASPPQIAAVELFGEIGETKRSGEWLIRPPFGKLIVIPAEDQEIQHQIENVYTKDHFLVLAEPELTYAHVDVATITARGGAGKISTLVDLNFADVVRTLALDSTASQIQAMSNADFAQKVRKALQALTINGEKFFEYHGIRLLEISFAAIAVPDFAKAQSDQVTKLIDARGDRKANAKFAGRKLSDYDNLPTSEKETIHMAREDRSTKTVIDFVPVSTLLQLVGPMATSWLQEKLDVNKPPSVEEVAEAIRNGLIDIEELQRLLRNEGR